MRLCVRAHELLLYWHPAVVWLMALIAPYNTTMNPPPHLVWGHTHRGESIHRRIHHPFHIYFCCRRVPACRISACPVCDTSSFAGCHCLMNADTRTSCSCCTQHAHTHPQFPFHPLSRQCASACPHPTPPCLEWCSTPYSVAPMWLTMGSMPHMGVPSWSRAARPTLGRRPPHVPCPHARSQRLSKCP